jgi:hypothetical protein
MRLNLLSILILLTLIPAHQNSFTPRTQASSDPEPDSGSVVCPPNIYPAAPSDCVPLGPSQFLAQAAASGIPYPTLPLPSYTPDSSLNDLPYHYFKVSDKGTPLFLSLADAEANHPSQYLAPGFLYVSYQQRVDTDQGVFYLLRSGAWIMGDGARAAVPTFQGLQFSSQPRNPFGWVLGTVMSHTAPGLNTPKTGHNWYRYNVVQIYDTKTADNLTWNLVAPDEWIDARNIGRVDPHTNPPQGVAVDRWIEVNLFEQTISVYENNQLVFATLVASGAPPFWTRPGLFQIYEKDPTTPMSGSTAADRSDYYYLEDVPFTMYFDEKRALHGAYWHNGFGYTRSHGCVNLSVGDSHWLFNWANIGDFVYVYDPSGQTPTDSSRYGVGAP